MKWLLKLSSSNQVHMVQPQPPVSTPSSPCVCPEAGNQSRASPWPSLCGKTHPIGRRAAASGELPAGRERGGCWEEPDLYVYTWIRQSRRAEHAAAMQTRSSQQHTLSACHRCSPWQLELPVLGWALQSVWTVRLLWKWAARAIWNVPVACACGRSFCFVKASFGAEMPDVNYLLSESWMYVQVRLVLHCFYLKLRGMLSLALYKLQMVQRVAVRMSVWVCWGDSGGCVCVWLLLYILLPQSEVFHSETSCMIT